MGSNGDRPTHLHILGLNGSRRLPCLLLPAGSDLGGEMDVLQPFTHSPGAQSAEVARSAHSPGALLEAKGASQ